MRRGTQLCFTVGLGVWAAAAATAPVSGAALVLAGAPAAAAVAWWGISAANRWLVLYFGASLLLPPMASAAGGGVHPALAIAAVGLLAGILRAREWQPARGPLPFALGSFLAVLACSVAFAAFYSGPLIAAGTLARVALFAIGVYVFLYAYTGPGAGEDPFPVARVLYWAGMASAAFACLDFHYQFPAPHGYGAQFVWLGGGVLRRAQGVFYEASTLGGLCVFFLVMIAVALAEPRERRIYGRAALAVGGVLFSAALALSFSRGSVVALAVALGALAWHRHSCRRGEKPTQAGMPVPLVLGLAAAGSLALHFTLPEVSDSYWTRITASFAYISSSPNGVLSGRLTSWTTLLNFLAREPWNGVFGIGYKTLPYSTFAGDHVIADNTYLSLLVETGATGLVVFLLMNAAILRAGWRAAKSPNPRASFFGKWIFSFWCGQLAQMFSGDLITYWRVLPIYLWVLATAAREAREAA